jgi:hypothetical protein
MQVFFWEGVWVFGGEMDGESGLGFPIAIGMHVANFQALHFLNSAVFILETTGVI